MNQLSRMDSERAKLMREYDAVINGTDLFGDNITVDTEKNQFCSKFNKCRC